MIVSFVPLSCVCSAFLCSFRFALFCFALLCSFRCVRFAVLCFHIILLGICLLHESRQTFLNHFLADHKNNVKTFSITFPFAFICVCFERHWTSALNAIGSLQVSPFSGRFRILDSLVGNTVIFILNTTTGVSVVL
jgi:hypothetical protein